MGEALLEEFNKKLKALSTTDTIVITSEWNITLTEEHKEGMEEAHHSHEHIHSDECIHDEEEEKYERYNQQIGNYVKYYKININL